MDICNNPEGQQQNGWKGFNKELRILLKPEPRNNKYQLQWGAGRGDGTDVGKNLQRGDGPLKSYREAVFVRQRKVAKSENTQNRETKSVETEKVKDNTKAVQVSAGPAVEGMVDSNSGATVTVQSKERITPRQPLRFFPDAAPVIPRKLGKGIIIHINEAGQRLVTWTDKGFTKSGKQWVPRDKHGDQKVGPASIDGPSDYRVTKDNARLGFGPRSTYEVGESSGFTKQQKGLEEELRVSMGLENIHNRDGPNLVDIGPNKMVLYSHGLPNLNSKESSTVLTGGGTYQLSVDWHLVEAIISTNRGKFSKVPV